MQKHVNHIDPAKSFPTNIYLQNLASIQKRTSPLKFAHLAEKSENGSVSNLTLIFSQMIKLYEARSLLYRRQILKENIRWKALDEIYKIYMLLHSSDLNISEFFRQTFRIFWQNLQNFVIFEFFSLIFAQILMKFCRNFADNLENVEIF